MKRAVLFLYFLAGEVFLMRDKPLKIILIMTLGLLGGCVTGHHSSGEEIILPPGVAYEDPPYEIVEGGSVWQYHEDYGWGWYHPQHGWRHPD